MVAVTLAGVGRVGRDFARVVDMTRDSSILAACSRDPDCVGVSLGELAGVEGASPVVCASLDEALEIPSDVLVLATASHLEDVVDDIRTGVEAGRNVVTTSEEALFPWANDHALAEELDAKSKEHGVTILGTGVNPGFIYDAIVLTAAGASWDVAHIGVERVVDISGYGTSILRRSGIGFAREEFDRLCASGEITGHIGFQQSMGLVAHALGRKIERIEKSIDPLFAESELTVAGIVVASGETAGFIQHHVGIVDGEPWFTAHLVAHVDPGHAGLSTSDTIELKGTVPVRMVIEPAFDSQTTVAAVLANSLNRVIAAPPGWTTVADLPPAIPAGVRVPSAKTPKEDAP